jgi:PAS domain S-box-containing protein
LKFFHRALLLVAVPLLFEVLFVGSLYVIEQRVEAEAAIEEHAKEISNTVTDILKNMMDGSKRLLMTLILSGQSAKFEPVRAPVQDQSDKINKLDRLLADDPAKREKLTGIRQEVATLLEGFKRAMFFMENQERGLGGEELRKLQPLMNKLARDLGDLRKDASEVEKESPIVQLEMRRKLKWILAGGVALNLLLYVILALNFNRGVSGRLSVLMDNSRRLPRGQPLNAELGGDDEIADLDRTFHQMAAELTLANETEKLILEGMPVGLIVTNSEGDIFKVNPTCEQLFGNRVEDLEGKGIDVFFQQLPGETQTPLIQLISSRQAMRVDGFNGRRSDGGTFPAELSFTSFETATEGRVLVVVEDVTQRRELERMMQSFVSTVRRDLQTPLRQMKTFIDEASSNSASPLDDDGREMAVVANRNLSRLLALVDDLLAIEHIGSHAIELNKEKILMSSIVQRALEAVRAFADQNSIHLQTEINADPELIADGDRLVQVLVNLLGNAIKFSPKGGVVRVEVASCPPWLEARVTDQGRGVPVHLREAIFERFKQVSTKDATEKKGTGLGLAICKTFIEQHEGEIGVDSEEGKGSTFWFRLPVASADSVNATV